MSKPAPAAETADKPLTEPLSQREAIELMVRNPAVRSYLYAAVAALAMIFVILFLNGSDIGAVMIVLLGCAGLLLRWTAVPIFVLVVLCYFQLFPFGVPDAGVESPFQVRDTHFQVADAVLVMAALVYVRSHYRILGLVHESMPCETVFRAKNDPPTRRPASHIAAGELGWMLAIAGAIVVIGQVVWWLVNALEFTPTEDFPLHWIEHGDRIPTRRQAKPPGEFNPGTNRFFMLLGLLFFGTLLVRLIFGYWRLRMMTPPEGAMVLVDTSWGDSHRERVRVEKWRIWGRQRAAEEAKQAERAQLERERAQEEKRQRAQRKRGSTGRGKR